MQLPAGVITTYIKVIPTALQQGRDIRRFSNDCLAFPLPRPQFHDIIEKHKIWLNKNDSYNSLLLTD